jgi:cytochrome c oxidase accessory protein FixG
VLSAWPVHGYWRSLRWSADLLLIAILLAIPWIRIGGEPLVLLDLPAHRFHVFGLVIFPQELYFLWLLVAILAVSLFFFTALAGRLWCGWACPQTVFTDVFAAIARAIEGWGRAGRPRRVALWRRALTHVTWLAIAALVGFHLVAYFTSSYDLAAELRAGTLSRTGTGFLVFATALTYLDFAWVRQTFCKYLCPYARFQSVLFDRDTLVVAYDPIRGEPRGKRSPTHGDCVDCGLCVKVCPTGIDIRRGMQLECIACTQCVDACNGVMEVLGRAPNLIGYRSLVGLERSRRVRLARPRVVAYAAMLAGLLAVFGIALARRPLLALDVAHGGGAGALYQRTADGRIGNAYRLFIQNRDGADHRYRISLDAAPELELVAGQNPVPVAAASELETRVFVLAGAGGPETRPLAFRVEPADATGHGVERTAVFIEPSAREHAEEERDED